MPTRLASMLPLLTALPALAQSPCDPSPVDDAVEDMLRSLPNLKGAALIVGDADGPLYEGYFGAFTPETVIGLASASKLLSGVAVMTLIDSGAIDPHAPIVEALPEMFDPGRAGPIKPFMTIDEMYSMTSGYTGEVRNPILGDLSLTMEEAVDLIATTAEAAAKPGEQLNYSGLGMHVAGHLCEVISGEPFDVFFAHAVSEPLGATSIGWQAFGPTQNFRPSGGATSNARDYALVLRVLARGGELGGVRLLSGQAVESMFTDRAQGLPHGDVPGTAGDDWGYGFGMWVEQRDDTGYAAMVSSPGAWGTTPWIDRERGYWGLLFVDGFNKRVRPHAVTIREEIETSLFGGGCNACPVDLTRDGVLDLADIEAFVVHAQELDRRADLTWDGVFDPGDIDVFTEMFVSGCG